MTPAEFATIHDDLSSVIILLCVLVLIGLVHAIVQGYK
jgi:hypothetical protein